MIFVLALMVGAPQVQKATIVFGGDLMLNQIPVKSKPLASIRPLLQSGDIAIANLEIPLTDSRRPTPYKSTEELKARTQYILKADPKHVTGIKESGIDIVSLGNNHVMDYGEDGLRQMTRLLTKHKIRFTGAGGNLTDAKRMVRSRPVALVSALAFMGTPAINKLGPATGDRAGLHALIFSGAIGKESHSYLKSWIAGQRENNEIMVVGLHWGREKHTVPTPYQVALARACIDAGADVVWGHHPHVLQGAELYKGKPILYSMGNLISKKEGPTGLARIYFENYKFNKFKFLPLDIKGMKVKPVKQKLVESRREQFRKLSQAIRLKFPHRESKPLY